MKEAQDWGSDEPQHLQFLQLLKRGNIEKSKKKHLHF